MCVSHIYRIKNIAESFHGKRVLEMNAIVASAYSILYNNIIVCTIGNRSSALFHFANVSEENPWFCAQTGENNKCRSTNLTIFVDILQCVRRLYKGTDESHIFYTFCCAIHTNLMDGVMLRINSCCTICTFFFIILAGSPKIVCINNWIPSPRIGMLIVRNFIYIPLLMKIK